MSEIKLTVKHSEKAMSPTTKRMNGNLGLTFVDPEKDCADADSPRQKSRLFASKEVISASTSCVMYVSCSTLMVLTNKWLASTMDINAHVSLLVMQNAVATFLVSSCKGLGVVEYADFELKTAAKWLPVNLYFVMMLSTSFVAMRYLSVPMITVFKQLANLLTVSGEWYFFGKRISSGVLLSFATMILGAAMAAWHDMEFSVSGYFWQGANCFCTSAYVLYLKYATKTVKLPKFGMVFYNNLLSLPMLLVIAIANNEPAALWVAYKKGLLDGKFFAVNAFAGSIGFLLNLASVWCVQSTSATTYAIVGALNKVPVTFLGWLLFHTYISHDMAVYISVSLAGGFLYSFEQLRQVRSRDANNSSSGPSIAMASSGGTREALLPGDDKSQSSSSV